MRADFANAGRKWEETEDLVVLLAATLSGLGHKVIAKGDWIELGEFALVPQVVSVEPLDQSGVNTTTTIQVAHPSLVPAGVFDYQHSSGENLRDSFGKGFRSWADLDLPVFLDSLEDTASTCMFAQMSPGAPDSALAPNRRLVFGPIVQMVQKTDPVPGDHDFCPCCLVTKNMSAFEDLANGPDFYGIRLFVSRDPEGHIAADCRVNGVEHAAGAAALARYAQSWPDRGYEYRKQYVAIQTREAAK